MQQRRSAYSCISGVGAEGDAKITKAGLRIAAPPKRDAEPTLIRVRPGRTTAINVGERLYVSAYMRNVLYTRRSIASQHLIMRPHQLAYVVLNAVAGDKLQRRRWRPAQSTPKVLASVVYPATLLEIWLHRVTIAA